MGDNLIINGLVRELYKRFPEILLLVDPRYFESISFMYRDLEGIQFYKGYYPQFNRWIWDTKPQTLIAIGHGLRDRSMNFDQAFYKIAKVPFEKRWDSFFVARDLKVEQDLFDHLELEKGKYIFAHDDNRFKMNPISTNLKIVNAFNYQTTNIFDWCTVIENAAEIHIIESSFMFLIESIKTNCTLYAHRYARQYPSSNTPTLKKDWVIL